MKNKLFLLTLASFIYLGVLAETNAAKKIRFAFMTDIHLNVQNGNDRYNGLLQALEHVKKQRVDFIILGGDVIDVSGMGHSLNRDVSDSLYTIYKETFDKTNIKYYPTIGNHDRFYDQENGFVEGDELFNTYFGNSYYTFDYKNVQFFVLNSVQKTDKGDLFIGEKQMEWLRNELSKIPKTKPIVVSTHVPVYSLYYPIVEGRYAFIDIIGNYQELLKTFEGYNLKLVLQGHQHIHEEIFTKDVYYVTGGAVCAGWWGGAFHKTEEGFMIVEVDKKDQFNWKYVDYEWEAK